MRKHFLFASCWLYGLFGFQGQAQERLWSLQQCIDYALDHNIDIKQVDLDVQRADINKQSAWGSFLPAVNGQANHAWTIGLNQNVTTGLLENQTTQFSSAGVDLGIDLFKGLQNQNQLLKARLNGLASRYQSQKMREDVALNVINAYLQIIFNKELIKTNQVQLDYDLSQLKRSEALVDAGVVPAGDLLDVKATLASSRQKVIVSQNELTLSKLALAQLLQIDDFQHFEIVDAEYEVDHSELLLKSPREIIDQARATQVDIKLAETRLSVAERDVKIAKGAYLPTLRGFYSFATRAAYTDRVTGMTVNPNQPTQVIGVVENSNQKVVQPNLLPIISGPESVLNQFDSNKGQSFGLAISIPIFNGLSARNNVKLNQIGLIQSQNELDLAAVKLEQSVYKAYTDTQSALQTYEAAQISQQARSLSFDYAKERYSVGLINIFELNQVQNLLVNAQSEVLRSKYDYIFKTKILEYYFGLPIFQTN